KTYSAALSVYRFDQYDYRWLYQALMITTIIIGIAGVWSTMRLLRGGPKVYRNALWILIIGTVLGGIQFFGSLAIRGEATPANVKFFTNVVTLILFLALKAPGVREKIDFSSPMSKAEKTAAGGMASIVAGITMLTVFTWAGPSHMYQGESWIEVLDAPLIVGGSLLVAGGIAAIIWSILELIKQEKLEAAAHLIR
ncbi:MAG: hypothetical protein OEV06_08820, partial [Anaerolineae bacterium]|nr:hypothetical protein [Anaerolineae bacterium]